MIPNQLLSSIPIGLRTPLVKALNEISTNYVERRWEPSELNGGKLCEVVYTIIDGVLGGQYAAQPSKPPNMVAACRSLESLPANPNRVGDRSLRVLIPRMLTALYEIRNNRGVGHVGGDVDPNFMDATAVLGMSRWVVAELIRVFHQVSTQEAQAAVDALVARRLPIIWERDGVRRVLAIVVGYREQTLLLLYSQAEWTSVSELLEWTEYSNGSTYRKTVLQKLHKERLVEFENSGDRVCLTSAGIHTVETEIIPKLDDRFY